MSDSFQRAVVLYNTILCFAFHLNLSIERVTTTWYTFKWKIKCFIT